MRTSDYTDDQWAEIHSGLSDKERRSLWALRDRDVDIDEPDKEMK